MQAAAYIKPSKQVCTVAHNREEIIAVLMHVNTNKGNNHSSQHNDL